MRYIDLFAGVGGFRYGIEMATRNILYDKGRGSQKFNPKTRLGFSCVYSNEWNKYANSVYKKHYGECDNRDIREVKASELPEFDLLCAGFPCQPFSIAGKRGGFLDTRGTLFFEIVRIVKQRKPRLLLLENVKGLLSNDQGATFTTIISTLDELGYDCQWQVLNSKNFGVPQNRERLFIIGHLRGTSRPEIFPILGSNDKNLKQIIRGGQGNRLYDPSGISTTIASQSGGQGAKTGLYAIPVLTPNRAKKRQNGRRMKTDGEPSFTLTKQDIHRIYDGVKIRRLTPVECERLQGFPDNWTQYGADGETISNTQRYKMMGNAVTTNVVTEIISRLCYNNSRKS